MSLPNINFLHLTVSEIQPGKDFTGQGQRSNQGHNMTLHTYTPLTNVPTKYQLPTASSKVKLRPHHDIAHLHPLTNVPTKYQLPTPYGFRDTAWKRFYRSRSKVKSRSQHDVAHLHPPNQCPYQVSTSYTLRFPRYSPDKLLQVKVTTARSKVKSR